MPALAVALVALVVGMGGGALAAGKLGSGDIKRNAIRSKHVGHGQIRPPDVDLTGFARASNIVIANNFSPEALTPRLTVKAKAGDVISYYGFVEGRRTQGSGGPCSVELVYEGPDLTSSIRVATFATGAFDDRWIGEDGSGATTQILAQGRPLPVVLPGRYTVSLRLSPIFSGNECEVRKRALWATTVS